MSGNARTYRELARMRRTMVLREHNRLPSSSVSNDDGTNQSPDSNNFGGDTTVGRQNSSYWCPALGHLAP
jgi:hypothetical protein